MTTKSATIETTAAASAATEPLGARYDRHSDRVCFRIFSRRATAVQLYFYQDARQADEILVKTLTKDADSWSLSFSLSELRAAGLTGDVIYYGYRAWGANWLWTETWRPGSLQGFQCDVDSDGNRFNPNKLLLDPYGREVSHDPGVALLYLDPPAYPDAYYGGASRAVDSGPLAPKSILLLNADRTGYGAKPQRPLTDDVIYEVNLRGLTMGDETIPAAERGTFRGAAQKAAYLRELGVTAVEFLPVQEFADAQNDDGDPRGDNYWGYMTLNYFAPNRRYAADRTPGGPTREFKEMTARFHAEGIKVFLDVVYNHTGEGLLRRVIPAQGNPATPEEVEAVIRAAGPSRYQDSLQDKDAACYFSYCGLDNASYYCLRDGNQRYETRGGCGANLNYDEAAVQDLIIDSLRYWADEMGVDGFRFDLAPVLSLSRSADGYRPNPDSTIFSKISAALPSRQHNPGGVDLIAEPWGDDSSINWLQHFPADWAVWNKDYRDVVKRALNKYGVCSLPVHQLAQAVSGSQAFIGKAPANSINYLVSHDDCNSLRNVFSYNRFWHLDEAVERDNQLSWDQDGDPALQRKAVRNAFALLLLSAGVPMFTGGDELFRTLPPQRPGLGKMNLVSVDSPAVYLDFSAYHALNAARHSDNPTAARQLLETDETLQLFAFVKDLLAFRRNHPSLRPAAYFSGAPSANGLADIRWYDANGRELAGCAWDREDFLGWRINAQFDAPPDSENAAASIYIAYNRSAAALSLQLPPPLAGNRWHRLLDTDNRDGWMSAVHNFDGGVTVLGSDYLLHERSILVLVEK